LHEKSTDRFESPRSDDQSPPAGYFFFDPPILKGPGTEVGIDGFGIASLVCRSPVASAVTFMWMAGRFTLATA
jgi:hypothetical protein